MPASSPSRCGGSSPPTTPKWVATAAAISKRLDVGGGLLYRYRPNVSPDGLEGHEGVFLLCSFWLVDNLAGHGRLEEAQRIGVISSGLNLACRGVGA